jgi:subtilase family serine protease
VDCTGALAAGASTTVTITTTVTASAGSSLTVTAAVDPNDDIAEANEANNSQTAITSVVAAPCTSCIDLVMSNIVASPASPVKNNNDVTYNFTVTNVGDRPTSADPAPNAVVVAINLDTVFNELTPVSASAPGFTCVTTSPPVPASNPEIVCTNASGLAAGAGTLFSVVAHANTATAPSFVDFDVTVDPGNQIAEFNEANNAGSLRVNTIP